MVNSLSFGKARSGGRKERAVRQDGNDHLAPEDGALPSRLGADFWHRMVIPLLANSPLSSPADVRQLFELILDRAQDTSELLAG